MLRVSNEAEEALGKNKYYLSLITQEARGSGILVAINQVDRLSKNFVKCLIFQTKI